MQAHLLETLLKSKSSNIFATIYVLRSIARYTSTLFSSMKTAYESCCEFLSYPQTPCVLPSGLPYVSLTNMCRCRYTVYGTSSTVYSLQTTVYTDYRSTLSLLLSGNCGSGIPFPSEEEEALETGDTENSTSRVSKKSNCRGDALPTRTKSL